MPDERFANHKAGTKAAWVVKRYGLLLLPELSAHLNLMPYEAAAEMERNLAEDLRRGGYTVTGGPLGAQPRQSAQAVWLLNPPALRFSERTGWPFGLRGGANAPEHKGGSATAATLPRKWRVPIP
jgi:hypothetical protein